MQLCVGDRIEYEFVAKKGKVQLWRGVLVSLDPEAERRSRSSRPASADRRAGSANRLPTSSADPDTSDRRVVKSMFEGLGSNKGKRKKRLSSSPLLDAVPKRKRGTSVHMHAANTSILRDVAIYCTNIKFFPVFLFKMLVGTSYLSVRTRQIILQRLVSLLRG